MDPELTPGRAAALRALQAADEQVAALGTGDLDGAARRRALLEIADAVEMALRRWLRDCEAAPLSLRLKALAPEELRTDEVLSELRQHDVLSMEAAAGVHELFEARRRMGAGSAPDDDRLALRVVERLKLELESPPPPLRPSPQAAGPDEAIRTVPPPNPRASRHTTVAALVALAAVVLVAAGIFLFGGASEDPRLAQGIALFRSGAYADAASRFWRYAEEHPDDPTPHLYLARIHRRMGRPDLAAPEIRTALRLAPSDADVHAELGFLFLDTDRPDLAVERFRAALRHDPDAAAAWVGLIRALRATGRDDAAARVLSSAPERVRALVAGAPAPPR